LRAYPPFFPTLSSKLGVHQLCALRARVSQTLVLKKKALPHPTSALPRRHARRDDQKLPTITWRRQDVHGKPSHHPFTSLVLSCERFVQAPLTELMVANGAQQAFSVSLSMHAGRDAYWQLAGAIRSLASRFHFPFPVSMLYPVGGSGCSRMIHWHFPGWLWQCIQWAAIV
jgi:hypothetical protein